MREVQSLLGVVVRASVSLNNPKGQGYGFDLETAQAAMGEP